jgi:hypothetical protein
LAIALAKCDVVVRAATEFGARWVELRAAETGIWRQRMLLVSSTRVNRAAPQSKAQRELRREQVEKLRVRMTKILPF